jgi:adenylate kinase
VKLHECHEGKDEVFDTLILDEDKLLDVMEPIMSNRGNIVDYHTCDLFPERWFDLVLVLSADTSVLYDRLAARKYAQNKINENMECEIMQVVFDSARESYAEEIVHQLPSNTVEDMDNNLDRIGIWLDNWYANNSR